jgi:Flp pilus assembly protein TadG
MSPDRRSTNPTRDRRTFSRGQIAIIFAGSILTFVALCAVVVDVSWYWSNTLRVQRAADAAALAGAVYLPASATNGGTGQAFAAALASAKQNGYDDALTNVKVTPRVDSDDPRQLDVQIDSTVGSFFAHALGISSWGVTRIGEGVYIQPVPMGSPDAYYGVGDFSTYVTTQNTTSANGTTPPEAPDNNAPSGTWLFNAGRNKTITTVVETNDNDYAFTSTVNSQQQWANFGLVANNNSPIPNPAGNQTVTIRGVEVDVSDVFINANCGFNQSVKLQLELSWNNGTNWTTVETTGNLNSSNNTDFTFGNTTSNTGWGTANAGWGPHAWVRNDLTDGNFRVRATYLNTGCGTKTLDLDQIAVRVGYTTSTTTPVTTLTKSTISNPSGTLLPSRGAWGTMLTRGADHENGDAYGPANDGGSANADYDPVGYDYIVDLPSGGTVAVFDPGFCAMGNNGSGGTAGAGDHWIGTEGSPVSTYYTLWNTKGAPGLRSTWKQLYTSGTLFENQKGYDPTQVPVGDNPPDNATSGCDATHDNWWTMPTGNLGPGKYAIQVQTTKTTDANINKNTNAENMWALDAMGAGAQIFGNGRMAVYNNLRPGQATQQFYLAQIDKQTGAGKTALLDIFDPGDVAGDGVLKILSPNGGGQSVATFNYTSDANCVNNRSDACARNGVTQITTANNGSSSFNNTWIHIRVAIPTTYGNAGLWQGGWWQIQYQVPDGGNDTTTWQVSVQGNPVHLIVP